MAVRLPRFSPPGGRRKNVSGFACGGRGAMPTALQRLLELAAFRIGERRLARLADRRRALGVGGERRRPLLHERVEDAQEVAPWRGGASRRSP